MPGCSKNDALQDNDSGFGDASLLNRVDMGRMRVIKADLCHRPAMKSMANPPGKS
jgi:hypothetical protein